MIKAYVFPYVSPACEDWQTSAKNPLTLISTESVLMEALKSERR